MRLVDEASWLGMDRGRAMVRSGQCETVHLGSACIKSALAQLSGCRRATGNTNYVTFGGNPPPIFRFGGGGGRSRERTNGNFLSKKYSQTSLRLFKLIIFHLNVPI